MEWLIEHIFMVIIRFFFLFVILSAGIYKPIDNISPLLLTFLFLPIFLFCLSTFPDFMLISLGKAWNRFFLSSYE